MSARLRTVAAAVACAAVPLAGCAEVESSSVEGYQPASIEEVEGSDLQRITLTPEGARRTGLHTATVTRRGSRGVVPYAALIYDGAGRTWVYRSEGRLAFMRAEVVVDRIVDDRVLLERGPQPGTKVATQGAAELYGAELGIDGGH
jgi:hypothetical protein